MKDDVFANLYWAGETLREARVRNDSTRRAARKAILPEDVPWRPIRPCAANVSPGDRIFILYSNGNYEKGIVREVGEEEVVSKRYSRLLLAAYADIIVPKGRGRRLSDALIGDRAYEALHKHGLV